MSCWNPATKARKPVPMLIQSITTSDFAVVECIVFLMAVIFVVINFIVDVLYCVINPRVRLQ